MTFPEVVRKLVFELLDMTRSFYRFPKEEKNTASAYATGYMPAIAPFNEFPGTAAAGVWTTPTDLFKLVRAIQRSPTRVDGVKENGNSDHQPGLLSRELAQDMLTQIDGDVGMALSWLTPLDLASRSHMQGPILQAGVVWFWDMLIYRASLSKRGMQRKLGHSQSRNGAQRRV